jgi:hypothetical protein
MCEKSYEAETTSLFRLGGNIYLTIAPDFVHLCRWVLRAPALLVRIVRLAHSAPFASSWMQEMLPFLMGLWTCACSSRETLSGQPCASALGWRHKLNKPPIGLNTRSTTRLPIDVQARRGALRALASGIPDSAGEPLVC